jgi:hypothetical protein
MRVGGEALESISKEPSFWKINFNFVTELAKMS